MKSDIILDALAAIAAGTDIQAKWKQPPAAIRGEVDGITRLFLGVTPIVEIPTVIRTSVQPAYLPGLQQLRNKHGSLLLLADRIPSTVQGQLKKLGIGFIDTAGNAFIQEKSIYIQIEGKKNTAKMVTDARAFSKGGLKVIFQLLLDEPLLNMPLRQIATAAEVSLDTVHKTIHALKRMQFLLDLDKDTLIWNNKRELLNRWITEYHLRLKPGLFVHRFDFLRDQDTDRWKQLPFKDARTCWGGEPAADLLTNQLKPRELTLYTYETDMQLTQHYRIVPKKAGMILVYKRFWPALDHEKKYAPPLLVYADLVSSGEDRSIAIAQQIFDEHLQNQFLPA